MIEPETRRIVRPYTNEELIATDQGYEATPSDRFARIVATHAIDRERYEEAALARPDMEAHFAHLIRSGEAAVLAWAQYYHSQHGVDTGTDDVRQAINLVFYDGSETQLPPVTVSGSNPHMANLPA